jgi:TolB-like protein
MPGTVRFDCFEVDLEAPRISKRGATLRLRDQSLTVLVALLERPGLVVTREDLRRRLWPGGVFVDFDNVLNTAVARLREAIGDSADAPRFIETLPKHGYRFMAPVHQASSSDRRPGPPRLMVLPLANTSGDPAQDYFASAMTDELITALASFAPEHLAVVARTTAFHYQSTRKNIATIAAEVGLDYVVEGSARRGVETAMINAQLIRVSDETHAWAGRYEVGLDDLLLTQKAIAGAIGTALGVATRTDPHAAVRKPTGNLEAYTLYRQGRHHLLAQTAEHFAAAKDCFEQAIARDPQFALAYDALADLWWYYDFMGFAPPRTIAGIGMSYALRALDIDGSLAETHALLGHYRWLLDYDWATVKRHLDRALELNPTSPLVRLRYAMGPLLTECRLEEAIDELEAALESDCTRSSIRCGAIHGLPRFCGR